MSKARFLVPFINLGHLLDHLVMLVFPTVVVALGREWDRPYSREAACFPAGAFRVDKYWPPVNRIDNVYGDRNLVRSCPPIDLYVKAAE